MDGLCDGMTIQSEALAQWAAMASQRSTRRQ